eukprot:scaffold67201_cov29-Tisochrysis_lutea.AAC.2
MGHVANVGEREWKPGMPGPSHSHSLFLPLFPISLGFSKDFQPQLLPTLTPAAPLPRMPSALSLSPHEPPRDLMVNGVGDAPRVAGCLPLWSCRAASASAYNGGGWWGRRQETEDRRQETEDRRLET